MTVVVGFVGPDGAVMASDSEATESGHTRYDVEKIWLTHGLLLGYTGNSSVRQRIEPALAAGLAPEAVDLAQMDRAQIRDLLQSLMFPVLQQAYGFHLGHVTTMGVPANLAGALLVVGRDNTGHWLLEIEESNTPTFYHDRGFHTVGSGAPAAYAANSLMEDYHALGDSLPYLKLMAYRTVQNCIDTIGGAMGVGGQVRLWSSSTAGFQQADDDELQHVAEGVREWRAIERESLRTVIERSASAPSGEGEALPEELDADAEGAPTGGTPEASSSSSGETP